jgi:uracil phosphoribosyltransferase
VVLTPILRAGLPLHKGLLNYFDKADNAFISAFRVEHKSGEMEIELQYISAPNVDGKVVIICDAMIATGSSIVISLKELLKYGQPKKIYVATAIASTSGLEYVQRRFPDAMIWAGAIDEELTAR